MKKSNNFSLRPVSKNVTLVSLQVPNCRLGRILVAIGMAWDGSTALPITPLSEERSRKKRLRKTAQRGKKRNGGKTTGALPAAIPSSDKGSEGAAAQLPGNVNRITRVSAKNVDTIPKRDCPARQAGSVVQNLDNKAGQSDAQSSQTVVQNGALKPCEIVIRRKTLGVTTVNESLVVSSERGKAVIQGNAPGTRRVKDLGSPRIRNQGLSLLVASDTNSPSPPQSEVKPVAKTVGQRKTTEELKCEYEKYLVDMAGMNGEDVYVYETEPTIYTKRPLKTDTDAFSWKYENKPHQHRKNCGFFCDAKIDHYFWKVVPMEHGKASEMLRSRAAYLERVRYNAKQRDTGKDKSKT